MYVIAISRKDDGSFVGTIYETDLDLLVAHLEEESEEDTDYYVDAATIDMLAQNGAGERLLSVLRDALGDSEGVDIAWSEA
jgi:hypothetical protein